MAKGSTWQKQKLAKHRANKQRAAHGGFARFHTASVETVEASGRYYSGDNTADRFRPVQERSAFHKMARQGEWKFHFEANEDCGIERRDGSARRDHNAKATSVELPENVRIRRVATHKVATREHLRDSLGTGSLAQTCMSQPKRGATWPLYNSKGVRIG